MTAILLVGIAAMAASLPVRIEGASTCPRPADVERHLTQLLTSSAGANSALNLGRVDAAPTGVRVRLIRADGTTVGERILPGQASCAELAVQVAVTIAAWHGDAYPNLTPTRPPRARSAPVARVASVGAAARAPASDPPASRYPATFDVGVGLVASGSGSWGPGLVGVGSWTPGGRGFGAGAMAFWEAERTVALGAGAVRWTRGGAGAGAHYRARLSASWLLEGRGQLAVGISQLQGDGFEMNRQATAMSPGAAAGVRLLLARANTSLPLAGWLDVMVTSWFWRELARSEPASLTRALPRSAVFLSMGASAGTFR